MKFTFLILILFANVLLAQNTSIDALKGQLNQKQDDSSRALVYRDLAFELAGTNPKEAFSYADECLKLSLKINWQKGIATAYNAKGVINFTQANYTKALENYLQSLSINEAIGNKKGIASNLGNIGNTYYQQNNIAKAEEYHRKALEINKVIDNKVGMANNLSNLGLVKFSAKDYAGSLDYYNKSAKLNLEIGNKSGYATNLNNIGLTYSKMQNLTKAIEYYTKTIKLFAELSDSANFANTANNIGEIYLNLGKLNLAESYFMKSLVTSTNIGAKSLQRNAHLNLFAHYAKSNKFKEALFHQTEYFKIRDSISNFESNLRMATLDFQYKEVQKDKEILEQKTEINQKNTVIIATIIGIILLSLLVFFIYTRFQIKKKSNIILEEKNNEIESQNIELITLNEDLLEQKRIVEATYERLEEKNNEILSSIRYAEKIQKVMLPFAHHFEENTKNYFILYLPKDIISGDFYWYNIVGNYRYFAVGDCTGHGVPGSMLSMIGSMILHESIQRGHLSTNEIMEYLDYTFTSAMSLTKDKSDSLRDGMDICLIRHDITTNQVEFCGAGRPLYYIQKGELKEIKGNNLAIGGIKRKEVLFESHTILLQGGEKFYLTSDGYADQSDEYRKKLGTKRLKELIVEIQSKDFNAQMLELKSALEIHKGETEQRDDVSIIGIEF